MKSRTCIFVLTTCINLLLINEMRSQTAECVYKYDWFRLSGHLKVDMLCYRCSLLITDLDKNTEPIVIKGQHENEKKDTDVEDLHAYKIQSLENFSSIFCEKFKNLEVIHLSNVQIKLVDEDALQKCENLKYFIAYSNKIAEIPENLFYQNTKMKIIWLHWNQLTTLPENLLLNQSELEILWLYENKIDYLPSKIFRSLKKLKELRLNNNKLQVLHSELFKNLHSLEYLFLYKNQIIEIPPNIFSSLSSLKELYLYNNQIKTLNSNSMTGLENLKYLSMHNNNISQLPLGFFTQQKKLEILSLRNNMLNTISSYSFDVQNKLSHLFLDNNKINSIDEKFIHSTALYVLNITNNICASFYTEDENKIKSELVKCFQNYRLQIQSRVDGASCGKPVKAQSNIIGGNFITRGSFPWIAALATLEEKYFCGGTIISDRKILSAAHCLRDKLQNEAKKADEFVVVLGSYNLSKSFEVGRTVNVVQNIYIHPDWHTLNENYDADISVLVMDREIIFNEFIQPICLIPPESSIESITNGIVVGYGKSEDQTKLHENIPKFLEILIHKNEDCFLKNYLFAKLSSLRTFCGGDGKDKGVCNGDSGGGLIVLYNNTYYIRGIISASLLTNHPNGCDVDNYSIFTNVVKFYDWINEIPVKSSILYTF